MFIHDDSIVFPKLRQCNLPSGRCYLAEDGANKGGILPSMTRILGSKPKPELEAWKKRIGEEEAARQSAIATVQGSHLHKLFECHLDNQTLPKYTPNVAELWQYLRPWADQHITRVYAQEQDVASFALGAAGRLDLLADVDDVISVVDVKTAKRPKKAEWIEDYFIQGSFYAFAIYEATNKRVKVERVIFPIVNPEGIQVFETTPAKHFDELRERIATFYKSYAHENALDVLNS
jgi:genome maintenance exonuclease 1